MADSSSSPRAAPYAPRRYWMYPTDTWMTSRTKHLSRSVSRELHRLYEVVLPTLRTIDPDVMFWYCCAHSIAGCPDLPETGVYPNGDALVLDASFCDAANVPALIAAVRAACAIGTIVW